jgi:hypothetical protein
VLRFFGARRTRLVALTGGVKRRTGKGQPSEAQRTLGYRAGDARDKSDRRPDVVGVGKMDPRDYAANYRKPPLHAMRDLIELVAAGDVLHCPVRLGRRCEGDLRRHDIGGIDLGLGYSITRLARHPDDVGKQGQARISGPSLASLSQCSGGGAT